MMRHLPRHRRSRPPCRVDSRRPERHTDPVSARDLERLAKSLTDRRGELSLTQEEFVRRAGTSADGKPALSLKQLQRIEQAKVNPRPKTLGALDRAAGWTPGSARQVIEGGVPSEADKTGQARLTAEEAQLMDALVDLGLSDAQRAEHLTLLREQTRSRTEISSQNTGTNG